MRRRSVQTMVKVYAESWRKQYVQGKSNGTHTVREIVHRHLDQMFVGALNAMMGIRNRGFGEIELVRREKGASESIMETLIEKHRATLEIRLEELLKTSEFTFKPDELRRLRRCYRDELLDKLEEKVRNKADVVAEAIVDQELRHIWMDDEVVAIVEGKLKGKTDDD